MELNLNEKMSSLKPSLSFSYWFVFVDSIECRIGGLFLFY